MTFDRRYYYQDDRISYIETAVHMNNRKPKLHYQVIRYNNAADRPDYSMEQRTV